MFKDIIEKSRENLVREKELEKRREFYKCEFVRISREFVDRYYPELQDLEDKKAYIMTGGGGWDSTPCYGTVKLKVSRRDDSKYGSDISIKFNGWVFNYASIQIGLDWLSYSFQDANVMYSLRYYGCGLHSHGLKDRKFTSGEQLMTNLKDDLARLRWIT